MLGVHGFFAVAVLCTFGARPSTGAEAPSLPIWCFGTDSRQRNTNLSCHRATGKIVREALRGGGRPFPVQLPRLAKSSLSQGRAPPPSLPMVRSPPSLPPVLNPPLACLLSRGRRSHFLTWDRPCALSLHPLKAAGPPQTLACGVGFHRKKSRSPEDENGAPLGPKGLYVF